MLRPVFVLVLIALIKSCQSAPETDVLVLLDNLAVKETHSIFFKSLVGKFAEKLNLKSIDDVVNKNFRKGLQIDL